MPNFSKASLQFTDLSSPEGFESKSVATENTVEPGPIVRELIQNSLDAGQAAKRDQVKVSFALESVTINDLPGIREYKKAFSASKKTHKRNLKNVKAVVGRIEKSLGSKTVKMLNVCDNGIGLNSERMNSLLGDGTTSKHDGGSAGSYGLGHFTAFPSSDLRFILYGGVAKNSERTASAHAILASHESEEGAKGKDGFLIKGLHRAKVHGRYVFPTNGEIPPLINSQLDSIEREYGSGSVISITAFNNFLEEDEASSLKAVLDTAAKHFFPAIKEGRLIVEIIRRDGSVFKVLDDQSLDSVFKNMGGGRRRGEDKLSSLNAQNSYETLTSRETRRDEVETSFGKITLCIRQSPHQATQINLFRSGMWITSNLPRNRYSKYSNYKQFNALVLLDSPCEAFDLVRLSEGEKHMDVNAKRLGTEERKKFNAFCREVREEIIKRLEKAEAEEFSPPAFMLLPPESAGGKPGRSPRSMPSQSTALLEEVHEDMSSFAESEESEHISRSKRKSAHLNSGEEPGPVSSFNRSGRKANVLTAAKLDGKRVRLVIRSNENLANAGVRLSLDSGVDASCEKPVQDKFLPFGKNASLNDKPIEESSYKGDSEESRELQIGAMVKNQTKTVTIQLLSALPQDATLKVDVVSRGR